ncbi:hypothetical protein ILUMI_04868 [Ignelater luminosus]|uniref:CRAL-TRIO domain-containing protein n=1 Tax=Ignelater luminosus TaxID=2038154 RepID=A0A8K0GGX8_IGNLU|nr:hypothetical protein ILUMI_04868 [Ignelater luminosus]
MVRWEKVDYNKTLFKNLVKVAGMFFDIVINENDNCVIAGQQILHDFSGFSFRYIKQLTPNVIRKCIMCLQSAYPTRIKGLHFINVPIYFRIIYNIVYPFLNKKLRERVHIYNETGVDPIAKTIPLSILPKEYGGQNKSVDDISSEWKRKVESYREWFLKDC